MDFEKWVNELQCEIDKIKRKLATLSGGGSTVSITPTLESGTKLADYTIDETDGAIYAPTQVNANWDAASGAAQILNKPTIPPDFRNTIKFYKYALTIPANESSVGVNVGDIASELANAHFIAAYNYSSSNIIFVGMNVAHTQIIFIPRTVATAEQTLNITLMAAYGVWPTTQNTRTTKKKK